MNPAATTMDSGSWMVRRLLPCVLLTFVITLLFGIARALVLFVPGVVGMLAGGLLGYLLGRLGRGDPDQLWPFPARAGITLGAAILYGVGSVMVVAAIHAGFSDYPLEWLANVIHGREGELFVGTSKNSLQSVGGILGGAWWVIFVVVDAGLFAFLHLIMLGVGMSPDRDDEGDNAEEAPMAPSPIGTNPPPLGLIGLSTFLAATIGVVAAAAAWPSLIALGSAEAPVKASVAELQGKWVFGEEASFFAENGTARRFTLSMGLGDEIACYSAEQAAYMIVMEPRRDGRFEGRILLRGKGELPVLMRVSPGLRQLTFTIRGISPSGTVTERQVTAHRGPEDG